MKNLKTLDEVLSKELENDDFKKEYDKLENEYQVASQIIKLRVNHELTQKELSDLTGISQSNISKLEKGAYNPSIELLNKLAKPFHKKVKITFE